MLDCSDKLRDHFIHPRNAGPLADANAVGTIGSMELGEALKLMLRIVPGSDGPGSDGAAAGRREGTIAAARFQAFGCSSAIATASALTELLLGRTVGEAAAISGRDIAARLGGLPRERMYCAVIGAEALRRALSDWRGEAAPAARPICACTGADAGLIERAVRANRLTSPEDVALYTRAGAGCSSCRPAVEALLKRVNAAMVAEGGLSATEAFGYDAATARPRAAQPPAAAALARRAAGGAAGGVFPARLAFAEVLAAPHAPVFPHEKETALAQAVIDEMRPIFRQDGGDVELIGIEGARVMVKLSGTCSGCQIASLTLGGLTKRMTEALRRPVMVLPAMKH